MLCEVCDENDAEVTVSGQGDVLTCIGCSRLMRALLKLYDPRVNTRERPLAAMN